MRKPGTWTGSATILYNHESLRTGSPSIFHISKSCLHATHRNPPKTARWPGLLKTPTQELHVGFGFALLALHWSVGLARHDRSLSLDCGVRCLICVAPSVS
eukprot:3226944-Pleurochrysis_carterae.AAC.2